MHAASHVARLIDPQYQRLQIRRQAGVQHSMLTVRLNVRPVQSVHVQHRVVVKTVSLATLHS